MSKYRIFVGLLGLIGFIGLALGMVAFFSWVFMLVWNATLVPWLHWPEISFWLATGMLFALGMIGKALGGK